MANTEEDFWNMGSKRNLNDVEISSPPDDILDILNLDDFSTSQNSKLPPSQPIDVPKFENRVSPSLKTTTSQHLKNEQSSKDLFEQGVNEIPRKDLISSTIQNQLPNNPTVVAPTQHPNPAIQGTLQEVGDLKGE
eukprot:Sdes_comp17195_c0_seq1m6368